MDNYIEFDGFSGYVSRPTGEVRGGLIVIEEIWGLVDHIKDIADRFARQGYLVVAPDILSHAGITPEVGNELYRLRNSDDEAERTRMQPLMREKMAPTQQPEYGSWAVSALKQVVDWLDVQPGVAGRIAATGFCFGGTYTFALAAADDRVRAAAPFYGAPPQTTEFDGFACPVRAFYGEQDERLITGLPEVEKRMSDAGVDFEATVYPGTGHAFFNDTNAHTYDEAAATDSWEKVNEFFAKTLA
ncbi:dienelactone hydrolase family protein [Gryllotalpicola protaetiae]|uniref:Dienelactone hydrolase family protein n=1 Tax=Gryllotalpicola protaetiae TaxID=2419771 RepID=A0A387BSP9_9MICO|nr:dienelactone hydrolase family protein [Gryllotalpicola protaetiae]AYG04056.1 dienelactone hydrolase family protein [Gryllotalpicola protaetiae]